MPPSDRAVQLEEGPFGSGRAQPSPRLTRPHCLAADVPSPPCWPGRTDGGAEPLRRPPAVPPAPRKAINTRFHRQTKDANRRGGWGRYNGVQTGSCPPSTHGITGPNPDPAPPKIPGPNPDPTPTPRIAWGPGWGQPPPQPNQSPPLPSRRLSAWPRPLLCRGHPPGYPRGVPPPLPLAVGPPPLSCVARSRLLPPVRLCPFQQVSS